MCKDPDQMIHIDMMQSLSAQRDAACPSNKHVDTILRDIGDTFGLSGNEDVAICLMASPRAWLLVFAPLPA
jgi:hypothetical protein